MSTRNSDNFNRSSDFLKLIVDNVNDAVCWKDTDSVFQGCNQVFLDLMGLQNEDELIGKSDEYLFSQSDAELFRQYGRSSFQLGPIKPVKKKVTLPTGKSKTFIISIKPLKNQHHQMIGVLWLFSEIYNKNISQEQYSSNQLDKLSIYFKNIIESLPEYIYWKDSNFAYLGCNKKVSDSLNLDSPNSIVGKTDYDFGWSAERIRELHTIDSEILSKGITKVVEDVIPRADGIRTMLTSKSPMRDENGELIGILGVSTDITELKETQKQLEKEKIRAETSSKVKSEIMSNLSHDLRTPLSGALAIIRTLVYACKEASRALQSPSDLNETKLLKDFKELTERGQEYGTIAQRAIKEISDLCDDILDTIRLESGQAKIEPQSFNLQDLVSRTINLLQPVAQERQLNLSAEIDAEVPRYLTGLPLYFNRTLLNLIGNGLKFTEKGGVSVRARLSERPKQTLSPGDSITLIITVEDTGIGIPQEKFETIFEHFSRLTPSYQGIYKGAGLGLYSVKQYVEVMKGQIEVSSEVGVGSCFTLTIPMTVVQEDEVEKGVQEVSREEQRSLQQELTATPPPEEGGPEVGEPTSEQVISREGKAPIRIMLVEDNPMLAHATAMSLQLLGWIVDRVGDGETAVEKAQQAHYDMIFMDIGLPKMDGIETTACIRALPNPEHAQVPIVALTGHAREDHYEECMAAGMNEVFRKPLPPALFEEALQLFARKPKAVKTPEETITLPPEPEAIVIDWEATIQACDNDKDHVNELLDIFMDDFAETERVLATAYENCDIKAIELRLHYTISVFYYLIFPQVDQALRALETVVKTTPLDQAALDKTYQAAHKAIQAMWKVLKAERQIALS